MNKDIFQISTYQIWDNWGFSSKLSVINYVPTRLEKDCLRALVWFLAYKGQIKCISELRKTLGYTEGYLLENEIRDMAVKGIYIVDSGYSTEINSEGICEPFGSFVNDTVPDFYNPSEECHFIELFAFQLIVFKTLEINEFLKFHLKETFKNDQGNFQEFLNSVKVDYHDIIKIYIDTLEDWIEKNLKTEESSDMNEGAKKFKAIFKNDSSYKKLMSVLSIEDPEKKYKAWFDKQGNWIRVGYDNASAAGALLTIINDFEYLENKIGANKIQTLIKEWFYLDVGKRNFAQYRDTKCFIEVKSRVSRNK